MRVRRPGPGGSVLTAALRRGRGPCWAWAPRPRGAGPGRRPLLLRSVQLGSGHRRKAALRNKTEIPELRRTGSGPLRGL